MTKIIKRILKKLSYLAAILILLAALIVSLGRMLTPYFNQHLPDFEGIASNVLHLPVKIHNVYISWDVYQPELTFEQVKILDEKSQRSKLDIDKVRVDLNFFEMLWSRKLALGKVVISGVKLAIQQNTAGDLSIVGFSLKDDKATTAMSSNEMMAWVFSMPALVLRTITVDFVSATNNHSVFLIDRAVLRNSDQDHAVFSQIILKQALETKIKFNLHWQGSVTDIQHANADFSADVEGVDLAEWIPQYQWNGLSVSQGVGSVKISGDWSQNRWNKLQAQMQFYDLDLTSSKTKKTFSLQRASGEIAFHHEGDKRIIEGNNLSFDMSSHLWPQSHFVLTLSQDKDGNTIPESMQLGYADLTDIQEFINVSGLVIPSELQSFIAMKPQGHIKNVTFKNLKSLPVDKLGIDSISLGLSLENVSIKPWQTLPGINNLSCGVTWDGSKGAVSFASNQAGLQLSSVFKNELQFDKVQGDVEFYQTPTKTWVFSSNDFEVMNKDIFASTKINLSIPQNDSPYIDLQGDFKVYDASKISSYLPLAVFDKELDQWLQQAFVGGQVRAGRAELQGRLADFPFDNGKGKFIISGEPTQVEFHYAPGWPLMHELNGKLVYAGRSMQIDLVSGKIATIPLQHVHADIPYFGKEKPQILSVTGEVNPDLAEALAFVHNSPLQKTIGNDLGNMHFTGQSKITLALTVPLKTPDKTQVAGDISFDNAMLALPDWHLNLENLVGKVHFTDEEIVAVNVQGKFFGEPLTLNLTTPKSQNTAPYVQAIVHTTIDLANMQSMLNVPLSELAKGKTDLQADLHLYSHRQNSQPTEVAFQTNLKGVELNLPEPFGKKQDEIKPLQVSLFIAPNEKLRTKINYNNMLAAALTFDKAEHGLKLYSGEVSWGGQANWQTEQGILLSGTFNELNWESVQKQFSSRSTGNFPMVRGIELKVNRFDIFGQKLNQLRASLKKSDDDWQINLNSNEVVGEVVFPADGAREAIQARFRKLYLASDANENKQSIDPKKIPAISIYADDVRVGDKNLGSVTLNAEPGRSGLIIKTLKIESPLMLLTAQGEWIAQGAKGVTKIVGKMVSHKISDLLKSLGHGSNSFIGANGQFDFDLSWNDAPYNPNTSSLYGKLSLSLGEGRIINLSDADSAKMGLGRLLNILSLQTLPRRLSLDFSDLSEKGYSFDYMQGEFKFRNGDAFTEDTHLDGPVARVSIAGRIGIVKHDLDLKMSLSPHVTSNLPMVATFATGLNPLAGVATWLVDKVIVGKAVSTLTTYNYKITGPWDKPVWTQ